MEDINTNNMNEAAQESQVPELLEGISNIRKCSFRPEEHFIKIKFNSTGAESFYLETKWRVFWFHVYCEENGYKNYSIEEGPVQVLGSYVVTSATVVMDGQVAGRAVGGCYVAGNDVQYAVQQAGTIAKGRALANAGFGSVFSSASLSENGTAEVLCDSGIKVAEREADFVRRNPMLHQSVSQTPEPGPTDDESAEQKSMTRAEALRYPVPTGRYKDEAMGDVMGKSPQTVRYYAENERFEGQDVQTAARLVLNKK